MSEALAISRPSGSELLSYQETLRTLGTLLEQQRTPRAVITLSRAGVEVLAPGWRVPQLWTPQMLRLERAAQRRWRQARGRRPVQPGGLAQRLRAVGAALDCVLGSDLYVLTVNADGVQVHGRGYADSFTEQQLARRLSLAGYLRGQLPAPGTPLRAPAEPMGEESTCRAS